MSVHPAETAPPAEDAYYTVAEVAVRLKVDRRTVYELISSGQLRAVRIRRQPGSDPTKAAKRIRSEDLAGYERSLLEDA